MIKYTFTDFLARLASGRRSSRIYTVIPLSDSLFPSHSSKLKQLPAIGPQN